MLNVPGYHTNQSHHIMKGSLYNDVKKNVIHRYKDNPRPAAVKADETFAGSFF